MNVNPESSPLPDADAAPAVEGDAPAKPVRRKRAVKAVEELAAPAEAVAADVSEEPAAKPKRRRAVKADAESGEVATAEPAAESVATPAPIVAPPVDVAEASAHPAPSPVRRDRW